MKLTEHTREMIFERIIELTTDIDISQRVAAKHPELKEFEDIKQDLKRGEIARLKQALFTDEFEFQH
jgi:hypothetical protein